MEREMKRFQKGTQGIGSDSGHHLGQKMKRFQKKKNGGFQP